MDIAQLLNVSDSPSVAQGGKSAAPGETGFAQLLQQLASAAQFNTGNKALLDSEALPGEGELSIETILADLESADGPSDTTLAALAALMQNASNATIAPGAVTPLAQQIAQALEAQVSPSQLGNSAKTAPSQGNDPFDLATVRQRLELIANAQQGTSVSDAQQRNPAQALLAGLNPAAGDDASSLRHRQLTLQGLQNLVAQNNAAAQNIEAPFSAQTTTTAEVMASASSGDMAQTGRGNDGMPPLAVGGNPTTTSSPTGNVQPQLSTAPTAVLSAPLASAQWQQGLGQQLVALHQRGGQRVDLHLHPAELGPLSVSLKVDDQLAQAQFFSTNPQVRAAIEQAIPQLREALEESGIQLGEAMVGEHQHDDGQSRSGSEAALAAGHGDAEALSATDEALLAEPANTVLGNAGNGVDLYA